MSSICSLESNVLCKKTNKIQGGKTQGHVIILPKICNFWDLKALCTRFCKKKRTFLKKSSVDQLDFSIYFLLPQHFLASLILFAAVSNRSFSPPHSLRPLFHNYIHTYLLVYLWLMHRTYLVA